MQFISTDQNGSNLYKIENNTIKMINGNNESDNEIYFANILSIEKGYNKEYQPYNIIIVDKPLNKKYRVALKSECSRLQLNRNILTYKE